jgi:hypothetical protein
MAEGEPTLKRHLLEKLTPNEGGHCPSENSSRFNEIDETEDMEDSLLPFC